MEYRVVFRGFLTRYGGNAIARKVFCGYEYRFQIHDYKADIDFWERNLTKETKYVY